MGESSDADGIDSGGLSCSHVAGFCQSSKIAGHRSLGSGLPKSTQRLPASSVQSAGCPSGMSLGGFGFASDFSQMVLSDSNLSESSFHAARPQRYISRRGLIFM